MTQAVADAAAKAFGSAGRQATQNLAAGLPSDRPPDHRIFAILTGASHVWDHRFRFDKTARNAAIAAIETEGAIAFMGGDNATLFRQA
jgi:hypothetical protein